MARGNGAGSVLMKCVLIVINIVFGIIGFALLVAGLILRFGESLYASQLAALTSSLPGVASSTGLAGASSDGSGSSLDLGAIIGGLVIPLIVIGLFLFVMALLGCIGACCGVKVVLIIYCVIILLLVIAHLILLGLFVAGFVWKYINETLLGMIKEKYGGIDDYSTESLLLNVIMLQFHCCGANNYTDFDDAQKWKRNRTMTIGGKNVTKTLITPLACCKHNGSFADVKFESDDCAWAPTDLNNNWKTSCTEELNKFLDQYKTIVYGVWAGIIVFQVVIAIFVICLLVIQSKEDSKVGTV